MALNVYDAEEHTFFGTTPSIQYGYYISYSTSANTVYPFESASDRDTWENCAYSVARAIDPEIPLHEALEIAALAALSKCGDNEWYDTGAEFLEERYPKFIEAILDAADFYFDERDRRAEFKEA